MSDDLSTQTEEIEVLESILNTEDEAAWVLVSSIHPSGERSGVLRIQPEMPHPIPGAGAFDPEAQPQLRVVYGRFLVQPPTQAFEPLPEEPGTFTIQHLPPIELNFRLPPTYPSQDPPEFDIACPWLNLRQTEDLKTRLQEVWAENEHSVILFLWYNLLKEEALEILGLSDSLDITSVIELECQRKHQPPPMVAKAMEPAHSEPGSCVPSAACGLVQYGDDNSEITGSDCNFNQVCQPHELGATASTYGRPTGDKSSLDPAYTSGRRLQKEAGEIDRIIPDQEARGGRGERDLRASTSFCSLNHEASDERLGRLEPQTQLLELEDSRSKRGNHTMPNLSDSDRLQGRLVQWFGEKKYGFIQKIRDKDKYFVHRSNIIDRCEPQRGDLVSFEIQKSQKQNARSKFEAVEVWIVFTDDFSDCETYEEETIRKPTASRNAPRVLSDKDCGVLLNEDGQIVKKSPFDPPAFEVAGVQAEPLLIEPAPSLPTKVEYLSDIVTLLKVHNESQKERLFGRSTFHCLVCFAEKFGSQCLQFLDCKHVYCKVCMGQYFTVKIREGCFTSLNCPNDGCSSAPVPNQIKELVSPELFELYESKLLETTLETMCDILSCPLRHCQCPTMIDRENNMGRCPRCNHAFCIYCKAAYHGVEPCKIKSKENVKLINEYMTADKVTQALIEKRYGRKQLMTMTNEYLSQSFMDSNIKRCPTCSAPIEKSEGCNKMACNKCNTNFCYLCGQKITSPNPYMHFNVANSECGGRLFDGVIEDNMIQFEDLILTDEDDDEEDGLDVFVL